MTGTWDEPRRAILVCQVGYVVGVKVEAPVDVKGPRDDTPPPVFFPNIPYSFNNSPSLSRKSPRAHF